MNERFWTKVHKTDLCWLWTGTLHGQGYGRFSIQNRSIPAHRFAYEELVGPIPEGLQIDHLCRVLRCVNPDHLEVVTQYENIMRGNGVGVRHARQTHCKYGHEFTPENTRLEARANGRSARKCRECSRIRGRVRHGKAE